MASAFLKSHVPAILIFTLSLGACVSKEAKSIYASGKSKTPEVRPASGFTEITEDLRQSTKFANLSQNIRFSTASSELSASNRRALNEIAKEIQKSEGSFSRIRISGLTDTTGDSERNQRLSLARAEKVRSYLISRGVSPDKLEAVGKGPVPSGDETTAAQHARDRRVDFEIVE